MLRALHGLTLKMCTGMSRHACRASDVHLSAISASAASISRQQHGAHRWVSSERMASLVCIASLLARCRPGPCVRACVRMQRSASSQQGSSVHGRGHQMQSRRGRRRCALAGCMYVQRWWRGCSEQRVGGGRGWMDGQRGVMHGSLPVGRAESAACTVEHSYGRTSPTAQSRGGLPAGS